MPRHRLANAIADQQHESCPFCHNFDARAALLHNSQLIKLANWVSVNEYEAEVMEKKTEMNSSEICKLVEAYIVTKGARGSTIYSSEGSLEIPPVKGAKVVDPTGCGDAYRAGLLYGLCNNFDPLKLGRLSSALGAIKVASKGTQNHSLSRESVEDLYKESFGEKLVW